MSTVDDVTPKGPRTGLPPAAVFTTRPTVTGATTGEREGIVVMLNGEDLVGVYPSSVEEGLWELGYWDAVTGEWVEVDDGQFTATVLHHLRPQP